MNNVTAPKDPRAEAFEAAVLKTLDAKDPYRSAQQIAKDKFNNKKNTVYYQGQFYEYIGSHYEALEIDDVRSDIYQFLETHAPFKANSKLVSDIVDALKSVVGKKNKTPPPFNTTTKKHMNNFISFKNGVVEIDSEEFILMPHSPDYFFTSSLDYEFNPDAVKPVLWINFLNEIFQNDNQQIEALQEYFGLCLTRITKFQLMLLLVGPKRSGKGTVMRVLKNLIGQANVAAPTLSSLSSQFGLASLIHKTLAIIADARIGQRTDVQIIAERLLSITGEDSITIERKFLSDWIGQLVVRFVWVANELPRIGDAGSAFSSRLFILVLRESFLGRENRNLTEELLTEIPGIANWALDGLKRLRDRDRFVQPDAGKDAIEAVSELGSPVAAFVHDECEIGIQYEIAVNDVYERFRQWSNDQGHRRPPPKNIFGNNLRSCVPLLAVKQHRDSGTRYRVYSGITLKDFVPNASASEVTRTTREETHTTYRGSVGDSVGQSSETRVPMSDIVSNKIIKACKNLKYLTVDIFISKLSADDFSDIESEKYSEKYLRDMAIHFDNQLSSVDQEEDTP